MKKAIVSLLLAIMLWPALSAQDKADVAPYTPGGPRNGAVVYALPRTEVVVVARARCTVQKPGPFAQYAGRYLSDSHAITKESSYWQLESLDIRGHARPDESRMYAIRSAQGPIVFAPESPILASVGIDNQAEACRQKADRRKTAADTVITFTYKYLGEEALTSTSIPKMAERAAKQIMQIREARTAILTADINHTIDGQALAIMLAEMDEQESELRALFLGKSVSYTVKREFTVEADADAQNMIVARMSNIEGLRAPEDMIGTPIYLNIKCQRVSVAPTDKKPSNRNGFYYTVPGRAHFLVTDNRGHSAERTLVMPQLGYVESLNQSLTRLRFNPETGEILSIE